jgi:hypothetical protein
MRSFSRSDAIGPIRPRGDGPQNRVAHADTYGLICAINVHTIDVRDIDGYRARKIAAGGDAA